jgi:hypothetical protein
MAQLSIPVSEVLRPFAELVVARLGYLYPKMIFSYQAPAILVSSDSEIDELKIRRDVLYALYREKIYAETLSMRQSLVAMVSAL